MPCHSICLALPLWTFARQVGRVKKICIGEAGIAPYPPFRVAIPRILWLLITVARFHLQKDLIGLKVNKLSSVKNVLPYEYYSLPYCRPEKIEQSAENLGEVLRGDRIENSLYQIQMRVDEQCKVLCRITALTTAQAKAFRTKIDDDYRVNM